MTGRGGAARAENGGAVAARNAGAAVPEAGSEEADTELHCKWNTLVSSPMSPTPLPLMHVHAQRSV